MNSRKKKVLSWSTTFCFGLDLKEYNVKLQVSVIMNNTSLSLFVHLEASKTNQNAHGGFCNIFGSQFLDFLDLEETWQLV